MTDAGSPPPPPPPDAPPGPGWWKASDGNWYPPESAPAPPPVVAQVIAPPVPPAGTFLTTIGDIGITNDSVVTPNGSAPLRGSQWLATDMTRTESKIPTWAIVCAIVFAIFCLLGLLFLLAKEQRTTGYVGVSVRSGDLLHQTQVPVWSPEQVAYVRQQVAYAQSLAARP